jgi:hypothetical protein
MERRDLVLECPRKSCAVEAVVIRFTTFEAAFNAIGEKAACPRCGGRLRLPELFPLPEEFAADADAWLRRQLAGLKEGT